MAAFDYGPFAMHFLERSKGLNGAQPADEFDEQRPSSVRVDLHHVPSSTSHLLPNDQRRWSCHDSTDIWISNEDANMKNIRCMGVSECGKYLLMASNLGCAEVWEYSATENESGGPSLRFRSSFSIKKVDLSEPAASCGAIVPGNKQSEESIHVMIGSLYSGRIMIWEKNLKIKSFWVLKAILNGHRKQVCNLQSLRVRDGSLFFTAASLDCCVSVWALPLDMEDKIKSYGTVQFVSCSDSATTEVENMKEDFEPDFCNNGVNCWSLVAVLVHQSPVAQAQSMLSVDFRDSPPVQGEVIMYVMCFTDDGNAVVWVFQQSFEGSKSIFAWNIVKRVCYDFEGNGRKDGCVLRMNPKNNLYLESDDRKSKCSKLLHVKCLCTNESDEGGYTACLFSKCGKHLATIHGTAGVKLWSDCDLPIHAYQQGRSITFGDGGDFRIRAACLLDGAAGSRMDWLLLAFDSGLLVSIKCFKGKRGRILSKGSARNSANLPVDVPSRDPSSSEVPPGGERNVNETSKMSGQAPASDPSRSFDLKGAASEVSLYHGKTRRDAPSSWWEVRSLEGENISYSGHFATELEAAIAWDEMLLKRYAERSVASALNRELACYGRSGGGRREPTPGVLGLEGLIEDSWFDIEPSFVLPNHHPTIHFLGFTDTWSYSGLCRKFRPRSYHFPRTVKPKVGDQVLAVKFGGAKTLFIDAEVLEIRRNNAAGAVEARGVMRRVDNPSNSVEELSGKKHDKQPQGQAEALPEAEAENSRSELEDSEEAGDALEYKVQYLHGERAGECAWLKLHHLFQSSSRTFDSLQGLDMDTYVQKHSMTPRDASKAELLCLCEGHSLSSFRPPRQSLPSYQAAEAGHVETRPNPLYETSSRSESIGGVPGPADRCELPLTLEKVAEKSQEMSKSSRFTAEPQDEAEGSTKVSLTFLLDATKRMLKEGESGSSMESEKAETSDDRGGKSLSDSSSKSMEHYAGRWVLANQSKGYVVFCKDRDDDKKRNCGILVQDVSDESNPTLRILCQHGCVSLPQFARLSGRVTKHPKTYIRVFKFGSASLYNLEKDDNSRQVYRGIAQVRRDEQMEARAADACFCDYLARFQDEAKLCQQVESGVALGGRQTHGSKHNPPNSADGRPDAVKEGRTGDGGEGNRGEEANKTTSQVPGPMDTDDKLEDDQGQRQNLEMRPKELRPSNARGKEKEQAAAGKTPSRRQKRNVPNASELPLVQTRNKRMRAGGETGTGEAKEAHGDVDIEVVEEEIPLADRNSAGNPDNANPDRSNPTTRSPGKALRQADRASGQGGNHSVATSSLSLRCAPVLLSSSPSPSVPVRDFPRRIKGGRRRMEA
eukprot:761342-Hanusia_phi.AAC.2